MVEDELLPKTFVLLLLLRYNDGAIGVHHWRPDAERRPRLLLLSLFFDVGVFSGFRGRAPA